MPNTKKAILRALLEGVLTDLMVKTDVQNVMFDDKTTLATKLAAIMADVELRAKSTDVTAEINNAVKTAIDGLIDGAPNTYDTLKEIADYIEKHEDAAKALQEAIGSKVSNETFNQFKQTLGDLATKSKVSENDLDDALKEKVSAAAQGNHSHNNKTVLDDISQDKVTSWDDAASKKHSHTNAAVLDEISQEKVTAWDDAASKKHTHENASVLDEIDETKVAAWDGKSKIYFDKTQPKELKEGDLWIQIITE